MLLQMAIFHSFLLLSNIYISIYTQSILCDIYIYIYIYIGMWASVVVAHGLSCSAACGIFLDQGSNPCPLHWQVDS